MAKVKGVKECIHGPIYDCLFVPGQRNGTTAPKIFQDVMTDPRVIRFFVDVQQKTKLETNLQAAGVLPSLNTFEARAMRVVISTPQASPDCQAIVKAGNVYREDLSGISVPLPEPPREPENEDPTITAAQDKLCNAVKAEFQRTVAAFSASTILSDLIYNSVTSLLVGEKIMIEMPTFYFPSGAGVSPGNGIATSHGEPDPMATFRFAEPVRIEPQQNFRVEMLFPQGVPDTVRLAPGPLRIWVILDGYLTRDVQ